MSTLVIVLRTVSMLAFAGAMLLGFSGRRGGPKTRARQGGGDRAPLVANLAAFGLFFPSLVIFSGSSEASTRLPLALSGCFLALAGTALVLTSRARRSRRPRSWAARQPSACCASWYRAERREPLRLRAGGRGPGGRHHAVPGDRGADARLGRATPPRT
jgi:hypothetical protein